MAHLDTIVRFTDDSTLVEVYPNEELAGVRLPPALAVLPYGLSRTQALSWVRQFEMATTLDHNVIVSPLFEPLLDSGKKSRKDLILEQRVKDGEDWYIDEFGFYVYAFSTLSLEKQFKDLRYD